jgi:hypothetical protein
MFFDEPDRPTDSYQDAVIREAFDMVLALPDEQREATIKAVAAIVRALGPVWKEHGPTLGALPLKELGLAVWKHVDLMALAREVARGQDAFIGSWTAAWQRQKQLFSGVLDHLTEKLQSATVQP